VLKISEQEKSREGERVDAPNRRQSERIYVKANIAFDQTGYMHPTAIIWEDGRTFPIETVRDFRPESAEGNDQGDCYTVVIGGQERTLFFERSDPRFSSRFGRWFVRKH
jgi:hypothetical protein